MKKRNNIIYEIKNSELYISKDSNNKNKYYTKNNTKKYSMTINNTNNKDNIIKNINNMVMENKKKIKKNQNEISDLISLIKTRENNTKKNRIQRQKTTNEKNFVKNGLNQIYTKTLVINNDHYYPDNIQKNKNIKNIKIFNSNFSITNNKRILQTCESVNNIREKISLNDNNKPIIFVNKTKSMKRINTNNIYIPKKAIIPQRNIYELNEEKNERNGSPIYHKKYMKKNKMDEYHHCFSSTKKNEMANNNNNFRLTYSKTYYSKSNPNFFKQKENKYDTNKLNFHQLKHFFERDIDELSSIHNNSSFESYTFDNDENITKKNTYTAQRNSIYVRKINKSNFLDINNNNNNNNHKQFCETIVRNKNNKINNIINNKKLQFTNNKKIISKNFRYSMSEGKLENINLESNEKNNDKYINNKLKSKALNFKQNEIVSDNNKIDERKNLYNKIFKKEITSFHLDDLVVLDEKLKNIILILNKIKPAYFACFDFLLYFKGNCDIFKNMNLLIKNEYDLKIIQNGINYILISIIFTFDYSYKQGILNNIILYMKEMINLAYQNLILIFDYFLKKTSISEIKSLWSVKLQNIIKLALDKTDKDQNLNLDYFLTSENNKENKTNIETIKNNTNFILQSIKIIIKNYKNRNSNIILLFLKEIYQKTSFKDIFYFFQNKILHSNGLFNYLSTNLVLRQNPNLFKDIIPPYIKSFSKKKFSLILGLEGTLIYSKFDSNNSYYINKISSINNIIELRPGLIHFLSEMKKYFELIIFSLFTQKIADYIINFIEKKEKYFEYRLYVQHATIIENEFIKEIKRIGRPINKIIIVDNFSQNYKTNKKNAINIKSYFEKNCKDNTLIELEKILPKIINNGNDVRNGIEKYRNEIIGKVSSNIDI